MVVRSMSSDLEAGTLPATVDSDQADAGVVASPAVPATRREKLRALKKSAGAAALGAVAAAGVVACGTWAARTSSSRLYEKRLVKDLHPAVAWPIALVGWDFIYYWNHRFQHESRFLWAIHVVHHSSEHYNLSTALRQTSTGALLGWVFYLPMAVLGVPPLLFGIVALVDLLYQFWVHTEHVGRLGWFDRVFCSPSNHRVHHAINDGYLDRNYGGILVLWDRMFGTFEPEVQPCIYGTRTPLNSWDPVWANLAVYAQLWRRAVDAPRWADKLRVWLKPPGWLPTGGSCRLAGAAPPSSQAFDLTAVQTYAPPLTKKQATFAVLQNAILTALGAWYLWNVDTQALPLAALGALAMVLGLWALGRYLQHQLAWWSTLALQALAIATVLAISPLAA
jgi:sterol desaturase/sphingolipid hydroxylase (fatty acid hydroxylase superfamily)